MFKATGRRLLAVLLPLTALLYLFAPGAPATAATNTPTVVFVGEADVSAGGYWRSSGVEGNQSNYNIRYDAGSGTLTLRNAVISGTSSDAAELASIYANGDLKIQLEGNSVVTGSSRSGWDCYGIYVAGNLSVSGSGYLRIASGLSSGYLSCGTFAQGSVQIQGATLDTSGGSSLNGESVGLSAAKGLTLSSGTLKAIGGTANISQGVRLEEGELKVSGGKLEASGGKASDGESAGIHVQYDVTLSNGTLSAWGGQSTASRSSGICTHNGDFTMTNGTLSVSGGTAKEESAGLYLPSGEFLVKNGTVKASADRASSSFGIAVGNGSVTMEKGTIEAMGGTATLTATAAVYAGDSVVLNGGSLKAFGGSATKGESYGVYALDSISVNSADASLEASAGDAVDASRGVCSSTSGITLLGGTLKASGGRATSRTGESCGVCAPQGSVEMGNLQGTGSNNSGTKGIAVMEARGGVSSGNSYGVHAAFDVLVRGGTLTATSSSSSGSAGIHASTISPGSGNGGVVYTDKLMASTVGGFLLFTNGRGSVVGSVELSQDLESPSGSTLSIAKDGMLTVADNVSLTINGGLQINNGGIFVSSGKTTNNGLLTNNGTFETRVNTTFLNKGTINNAADMTNNGDITNDTGATISNSGMLINNGAIANNGSILVRYNSDFDNNGTVTNNGSLSNSGTIDNSGVISGTLPSGGGIVNGNRPGGTAPQVSFISDTTSDVAINNSYQFRITSMTGATPVMTLSNNHFRAELASQSGRDYYFKVYVVTPGQSATVYLNGKKLVNVTTAQSVISDTTSPFQVKKGSSYQFRITASSMPTFVAGSPSFRAEYAGSSGNNYFFKVYAIGNPGDACGFYINKAPTPVAVGTVS